MAFTVFDEFVHFIVWPHFVVYALYLSVKYLSFSLLHLIEFLFSDDHFSLFCVLTCGCFCGCCVNCCGRANNLLQKIVEYNLKFGIQTYQIMCMLYATSGYITLKE